MSHEIIMGIRIDAGNQVYLRSSSNNVSPRHFDEWECKSLSSYLAEHGKEAFDLELMRQYENGNFKSYSGRFVNALRRLRAMPEYKEFDWRSPDYETVSKARKERKAEFDAILLRALHSRDNLAERRIVQYNIYETPRYVWKSTRRHLFYTHDAKRAKVFFNEDEARAVVGHYSGKKDLYQFLSVEEVRHA